MSHGTNGTNGECTVSPIAPFASPMERLEARVGLLEIQLQRILENQSASEAKSKAVIAAAKSGNPMAILEAISKL